MKKLFKVFFIIVLGILVIFALAFISLNIAKRIMYEKYYTISDEIANNGGLGSGYTPYDLTSYVVSDKTYYFTCGSTRDNKGVIYMIRPNMDDVYFTLKDSDNNLIESVYTGICTIGNYLVVSTGNDLYLINLDSIIKLDNQTENYIVEENVVAISQQIELAIESRYLYVDKNDTSTMRDDLLYITSYNAGETLIYEYSVNSLFTNSLSVLNCYNVDYKIDGFAIDADKVIIIKQNGKLSPSYIYIYERAELTYSEKNYILTVENADEAIKAPSLISGLDYDNNRYITMFQSANNSNVYGKFMFMNKIVSLKI